MEPYSGKTSARNLFAYLESVLIILLALVPLFLSFPYRVNIFLSWEGAYRMSNGEMPFRDFGTPLGGMYWVIPAIFFKLFGPGMFTLVKAQVFINIISGLAFRSILKSCGVNPGVRLTSVFLYCLSFSFFNFWPWYNHTVIVYEFIALAFLLKFITGTGRNIYLWLGAAALFSIFSFLTKQDGGGMCFGISLLLLTWYAWANKKIMPLLVYTGSFILLFVLIITPFLSHGFGYWFNHGQAPHTARISVREIAEEFFGASFQIKFYIVAVIFILILQLKHFRAITEKKKELLFPLLTLAILGEAAVFQVTSYTPPDNNVFYHAFAVAFILQSVSAAGLIRFDKTPMVLTSLAAILLWWSQVYWKYVNQVLDRVMPPKQELAQNGGENIVNRKTYMLGGDTTEIPMSKWVFCGLKSFDKIYMPQPTVDGIHRLMDMDLVKNHKDLHVLNMSELTPLAAEIPFQLEKGSEYPLWYHLGVGMFNKQAALFESKIAAHEYDLVLFEYIPRLNNFYPFRVRDSLKVHYQLVDSFLAPRRGAETRGNIEVYVRPQSTTGTKN